MSAAPWEKWKWKVRNNPPFCPPLAAGTPPAHEKARPSCAGLFILNATRRLPRSGLVQLFCKIVLTLFAIHEKPRLASRSHGLRYGKPRYAKNYLHYDTEFGVFVVGVEKVFSTRSDWHQDQNAQPVVEHYQLTLDSVIKAHPELRGCVSGCAHCGIRFLTDPRNAGRRNLRCPFGCREHIDRQRSSQRSTAYYQTVAGKRKKQSLNRSRRRPAVAESPAVAECGPPLPPAPDGTTDAPTDGPTDAPAASEELRLDGVVLDEASLTNSPVLPYLRMLVSLIEGVRLSAAELLVLLRRALRQHSIVFRKRRDYVLRFLRQHPP